MLSCGIGFKGAEAAGVPHRRELREKGEGRHGETRQKADPG